MTVRALIIAPTYDDKQSWPPLIYTKKDADGFKELLVEVLEVSPTDIKLLDASYSGNPLNGGSISVPDIDNILQSASAIINDLQDGDTFIFFFSGHGLEIEGIKLIPQYCLRSNVRRTAFDLENDLLKPMHESKKDISTLFIIDACRCIEGIKGITTVSTTLPELLKNNRITGLLACSRGETSKEIRDFENGVFTYFLIESIKELKESNDLTINNLYDVVRKKVNAYTGKTQNPELILEGKNPLEFLSVYQMTNNEKISHVLETHPDGLTDKQMQELLKMNGNSQRPGRKSLEKRGIIISESKLEGEKLWKLSKYSTEPKQPNMYDY